MLPRRVELIVCVLGVLAAPGSSSGDATMPNSHRDAGVACVDCHKAAPPSRDVPQTVCIACHGNLQSVAGKTSNLFPNPHAAPHASPGDGESCVSCHHVHRPAEVTCQACHRDFFFRSK